MATIYLDKGTDGVFSASAVGAMGRTVVCDDADYHKAILGCNEMLEQQQGECYAHEQAMTVRSLELYGEPKQ